MEIIILIILQFISITIIRAIPSYTISKKKKQALLYYQPRNSTQYIAYSTQETPRIFVDFSKQLPRKSNTNKIHSSNHSSIDDSGERPHTMCFDYLIPHKGLTATHEIHLQEYIPNNQAIMSDLRKGYVSIAQNELQKRT